MNRLALFMICLAAPVAAHEGLHIHPHSGDPSWAVLLGAFAILAAAAICCAAQMIPGEILCAMGTLTLNAGSAAITLMVANTGDRPVQVGSHYHFAESNPALDFDRDAARGRRLDIAAGTAVRFEPGQRREVQLIEFTGARRVFGFNGQIMGDL